MKKKDWAFVGFLVALIVLGVFLMYVGTASASSGDVIQEWYRTDGSICSAIITEYGVAIDCDCPCLSDCTVFEKQETLTPTDTPQETPTAKPKCNSGRGNGSEFIWDGTKWVECDPGSSGGHNQGGDKAICVSVPASSVNQSSHGSAFFTHSCP